MQCISAAATASSFSPKLRPKRIMMISSSSSSSSSSDNTNNAPPGPILLVGVTGGTGRSVLGGLLAAGIHNSSLKVLTRNPQGSAAKWFEAQGVGVIAGDLDDADTLKNVVQGVRAIYCHATSKDGAKADPEGEIRAERLAKAAASAGVEHIVYNSSGSAGFGISQVEQKVMIESIFKDSGIPTTNLRATLFMEEFWKVYTRPQILKGTFPFSMPSHKPLQLVAVKDVGLAAGVSLKNPKEYGGFSLELAGDELTPLQMCEAFSQAQGGLKVNHSRPPKFLFWFINRDLYRIATFLSDHGYTADIANCRERFPGILKFDQFLQLTKWGDASRMYADGFQY